MQLLTSRPDPPTPSSRHEAANDSFLQGQYSRQALLVQEEVRPPRMPVSVCVRACDRV